MNGRPTRRQAEAPVQKKSPRVAPRGKVGWWRKSTYTTIDTWYREKLHLFEKKMQEIVAAKIFPFRRYQVISRFELKSLVRKLLAMDIMAVFAAFLEISRRSLGRVEIVLLCSFHDIAGTLNIRFSKIHGVLSFLGLEKPGSLSE